MDSPPMFVIKRDGTLQLINLGKITRRIAGLCKDLNLDYIKPITIAAKIFGGMRNEMTTCELDKYIANYTSTLIVDHPDFGLLAGRILATNLQKRTPPNFSLAMTLLHDNYDEKVRQKKPLIADDVHQIILQNTKILDATIMPDRDLDFAYFGFRTLERSYLLQCNGKVVETPQFMLLRVSLGIHKEDIKAAIETYHLMSEHWFTHATPTLFNSGKPKPQLASCYLLSMTDDSIDGIYETLKRCAIISKYGGGIGLSAHNIRAAGSAIDGTPGVATGLLPMLKNFNYTSTYVNQGGKRAGAFAVYLEPWHADIFDFLHLRLNVGPENVRCRDLFLSLWIPDLFMERVETDKDWSLMSPDECPGLSDYWGDKFNALYEKYENQRKFRKQVKARDLFRAITTTQCETGLPYMLFKDACNRKSNQQHWGTIKCSNLCTEIVEFTSPKEVAVCNLASIALNKFVTVKEDGTLIYDFEKLRQITKVLVQNLNKIIDVSFYPLPEAKTSNFLHRPIGIGVQGLADTFMLMRLPFTSPEAMQLNKEIFETIYFGALQASCDLAQETVAYYSYPGSPIWKGILQFDMWSGTCLSSKLNWDWGSLRQRIAKHGVCNSLLVAPMPTASTAQILGNNEAFEPYTSNLYTRRVSKGDFQVVNRHLIKDLIKLNLWNSEMRDKIIAANGSVQEITELPSDLKELYKTVWELKQLDLIQMAADRGPFIDQSQSLNLFVESPNFAKLSTLHFKSWKSGLKTGMYYLRSKPSTNPIKFTIKRKINEEEPESSKILAPILGKLMIDNEKEGCEMCSS